MNYQIKKIITFNQSNQTKTGSIIRTQLIPLPTNEIERKNTYITAGLTSAILVGASFLYFQYKPENYNEKQAHMMIKKHSDLIVDTKNPPRTTNGEVVQVNSLHE